jgi:cystathionine beta-lyase
MPMSSPSSPARPATLCIHAGTYHDERTGGACSPIFPSTAYAFPNAANENFYPRYFNTPNQRVIEAKTAALEKGEAALVFGSGMAAISTLVFAHLKPGDHAIFQADLYGGTFLFVQELTRFGIAVSLAHTVEDIAASLRPETRVVYVESPSNPLLRVMDLEAIGALGRDHGVLTVADNTFATPINQNPLTLGLDVVVHSGTKYLGGHSDLQCGLAVTSAALAGAIRHHAVHLGGSLNATSCHLLERSLKTLHLRLERQTQNAGRLAEFLAQHPTVAHVHYPGLPTHPGHAIAREQMRGFGAMLAFDVQPGAVSADAIQRALRLIRPAASLGGVETTICAPVLTSHVKVPREERERLGITDTLLRLSVGIEHADDLIADLAQALGAAA